MIKNLHNEYKNEFAPDNVYGHVVSLLQDNLSSDADNKGIHLDLGCGYAAIAEYIQALGRDFVGVDGNQNAIDFLKSRGFEAICTNIDASTLTSVLKEIIAGRKVSSISLIDTLEHLADGPDVLHCLYEIARKNNALLLISVPNIAHRDVGFKLALGRIDYTEAGILDHTHVKMYDEQTLLKELGYCGFHIIATNHVKLRHSDQSFPKTHPVLQEGTTLRAFLKKLRAGIDTNDIVNQLVVAALPGEKLSALPFVQTRETSRPFLSVVTRTQGNRIQSLNEYFTCMLGQSDRDFEILVMGHKLSVKQQIAVEQIIEDLPEWLREKTRLHRVDYGNRTHPLNVGFRKAQGEYIAIHDDDDLPFGHWVETFKKASFINPGRMIRAVSVLQSVERKKTGGWDTVKATESYKRVYPVEFDYLDHLVSNGSPNNTIAFPRGLFEDLHIYFDESLTTTEDWDLILRGAPLVGVTSIAEITGIYQWVSDNSSALHGHEEWLHNQNKIVHNLNNQPLLLPSGCVKRIISLLSAGNAMMACPDEGSSSNRQYLLKEIASVLESRSWIITAPMRWVGRKLRKTGEVRMTSVINLSESDLCKIITELRLSTSWKITAPLRTLRFK